MARKTKLNELLYERLRDRALKIGIEVVGIPYQVKVFKGVALESVLLDAESLKLRTAKELVHLEHKLRNTGFASEVNETALDVISAYCSENIPRYIQMKNKLKKTTPVLRRPSNLPTESERVIDEELLSSLPNVEEEGEIRSEDH